MKRYAFVIKLRAEAEERYKIIHREVWPEILKKIALCNIRNYSIYLRDGFLFASYEYHGKDHKGDMAKMAADPKTQEWWKVTMPMQEPLPSVSTSKGDWWAEMEEVFHLD